MVDIEEYIPNQGDIIWLNDNYNAVGHEQKGRRPGLVISERKLNVFTKLCFVCPITNNAKVFPFQVALNKKQQTTGVVMCEQMRVFDFRNREVKYIEKIKDRELDEALEILRWLFF